MKFATLALAILLAAGCQAASLQADAPPPLPSYVEHLRGLMNMAKDQFKNSADSIADRISDQETKDMIKQKAQELYDKITAAQEQAKPITDGAVATIDEATRDMRTSIYGDIDNLKTELEPMRKELHDVVQKHIDEYKALLQNPMDEYRKYQEEMTAKLKSTLEPLMEELRAKFTVNVEETKSKLLPIIEAVRAKADDRIKNFREMLNPYVQEYKDQLKAAYDQTQDVNYDEVRQKLEPHLTSLKTNFDNLINELRGMMG